MKQIVFFSIKKTEKTQATGTWEGEGWGRAEAVVHRISGQDCGRTRMHQSNEGTPRKPGKGLQGTSTSGKNILFILRTRQCKQGLLINELDWNSWLSFLTDQRSQIDQTRHTNLRFGRLNLDD